MSLPAVYLSKKLTQPLPTKGGTVLRTIGDAANYVLALPPERAEHCNRWRHAAIRNFVPTADSCTSDLHGCNDLLEHLVRLGEQHWRNFKAERLCCLEVNC